MTACEGSRCGLCPGWGGQSTGTPQPPPRLPCLYHRQGQAAAPVLSVCRPAIPLPAELAFHEHLLCARHWARSDPLNPTSDLTGSLLWLSPLNRQGNRGSKEVTW